MPDESSVTFTYFEPGYSELHQYGPTFICGKFAATDIQTKNDPARDYQSSQMRLISLPNRETELRLEAGGPRRIRHGRPQLKPSVRCIIGRI